MHVTEDPIELTGYVHPGYSLEVFAAGDWPAGTELRFGALGALAGTPDVDDRGQPLMRWDLSQVNVMTAVGTNTRRVRIRLTTDAGADLKALGYLAINRTGVGPGRAYLSGDVRYVSGPASTEPGPPGDQGDPGPPGPSAYPIQALTLTSDLTLNVGGAWPDDQPIGYVITQDGSGSHSLTLGAGIVDKGIDINPAAGASTFLIFVPIAAWDEWWCYQAGVRSPSSDVTPPVWSSGILTTGDPTHEQVTVTANELATDNVAVTGYEFRLGPGDIWRPITPAGLVFTITDLEGSTAYAAPQFRALDGGGNASVVLTAQAFTTDPTPPGWVTNHLATFTAPDGTAIADYVPDMGGALTRSQTTAAIAIYSNATRVSYIATSYPAQGVYWPTTNADFNLRFTITYAFTGANANKSVSMSARAARAAGNAGDLGVNLSGVAISISNPGSGGSITETSGLTTLPPLSGTAVMEITGSTYTALTVTLRINGTLFRQWTVSWVTGYGTPLYLDRASFSIGGGDIHAGLTVAGTVVSDIRVEYYE